ncbi:caspase-3 [Trichonephila inaurata madagascariensis]|uniref:Caspase-3 n=1 Tax=Trichonephila inaurata madagascariensis TaxID=2747483 RepID=A0A8X6XEB6_9ARAC|nr:caspase-3 [Trichonephila inaurata madagascariensis]
MEPKPDHQPAIQMNDNDSYSEIFDVDDQLNRTFENSLSLNYNAASFQENISTDPKYQEFKKVKFGDCYIFNYQMFEGRKSRLESENDVKRLKHVFGELNFDVFEFKNLSQLETTEALKKISEKDHSQKKYFVCCFLTHGGPETLCTSDKNINVSDIFSHFTRSSCPTLSGKPKIFIIQACRGSKYETEESVNCADYFLIECNKDYLDFLIVNSTYYDTVSFKSSDEEHSIHHGAFFIDELCRSLEQFSGELELLQILTIVNYRVSYLFLSKSKEKKKNMKKQVPCFVSRLRTDVKFEKPITPFVSYETLCFDKRRKESRLGLESTENPLSDKECYQLQNPENIMFLSIADTNIVDLRIAGSILWNSFAGRKYSREEQMQSRTFKRSEIMQFLKKNLNSSEADCLICFLAGDSRNGRLLDANGRKISKEDVIKTCESFTGKPKIFIYLLRELPYVTSDSADGETDLIPLRTDIIPFHADILEICITITEWKQAIGPIETFCQIFNSSSKDFINLLTKINHELVKNYNFFGRPGSETSDECNHDTFMITSTLTKHLFLP